MALQPRPDLSHATNMTSEIHPMKEIAFGAILGIVGKLVDFPLDTVKVRLQSSNNSIGTLSTISSIYKTEGLASFYRGLHAPLFGACLENATIFTAYSWALAEMGGHEQSMAQKCSAGAFSGIAAAFVLTPVELVKCKMQVLNLAQTSKTYTYVSTISDILRLKGVLGLWHGLWSTIIRESLGTAIYFGTYEFCNMELRDSRILVSLQPLLSGAAAGITYTASMFPIDTVKSNVQTHDVLCTTKPLAASPGMFAMARQLYRLPGGFRNFYRGVGITVFRAAPANALIFYTYETLKATF